jgi:hypothetical protein
MLELGETKDIRLAGAALESGKGYTSTLHDVRAELSRHM